MHRNRSAHTTWNRPERDRPECEDLVFTYWRWPFASIEPRGIYFLKENCDYCYPALRLSQSPSLLISGSGSWPQREGLLSPAARQIYRRNFPPMSFIQSRTVLLMCGRSKPITPQETWLELFCCVCDNTRYRDANSSRQNDVTWCDFFAGETNRVPALSLAFTEEDIKNLPLLLRAREKI